MNVQPRDVASETVRSEPIAGSRCSIRVVPSHGDLILVYEPEEKTGPRKLVFESSCSYRALTRFPMNWRRLSDAELLALRAD